MLNFAFWLPPGYPILVNFTAALVPASFLADLLGRLFRRDSLCHAGFWMLMLAGVLTPFTVYAGWDWKNDLIAAGETIRGEMIWHQWLGFSLAPALLLVGLWRLFLHLRQPRPTFPYLGAMLLVVAALVVQAHLGGRMTFGADETPPPTTTAPTP